MAKILVIDDSPTELFVISKILEEAGHQVLKAEDGQSGIELAKQQIPDAVLMDVVMPGLNGFQATRKLSKDATTAHIPVVMVTTKDQETDREWAMKQGAKDYLVKPVNAGELLAKIQSLVG